MLYESGDSITIVAKKVGLSQSTVRLRLLAHGALRTRTEGIRLAAKDGRLGHQGNLGKKFSQEAKEKMRLSKIGKGKGTSLKPNGYVEITMGENKHRGEHRVIMESRLCRKLKSGEVVHHKDGNRSNNNIDNLEVMSRAEHASHHAKENDSNRQRDNLGRYI